MPNQDDVYRKLAAHLDLLPGGFPPSETGADLRLLRMLFTPEEAELATHLTLDLEEAAAIAHRAGLPTDEVEELLQRMAREGLIFAAYPPDRPVRYRAAPWIVGIYEFQVGKLQNDELRNAINEYFGSQKPRPPAPVPPYLRTAQAYGQVRTVPIGKSVEALREVLPYEQIYQLVEARERFAVAPCICRRQAKLAGGGCDAPEDTCLFFDDWADYYARNGLGRYVERSEVMAILEQADAHNLVIEPSNSQEAAMVCCCCGCCCGVLGGLKQQPKPAEAVASAFIARYEAEECNGCFACLERCQMQALSADSDRVAFSADRCIGCGLCTSICPTGALKLVRKPEGGHLVVPADLDEASRILAKAQAELQKQERQR